MLDIPDIPIKKAPSPKVPPALAAAAAKESPVKSSPPAKAGPAKAASPRSRTPEAKSPPVTPRRPASAGAKAPPAKASPERPARSPSTEAKAKAKAPAPAAPAAPAAAAAPATRATPSPRAKVPPASPAAQRPSAPPPKAEPAKAKAPAKAPAKPKGETPPAKVASPAAKETKETKEAKAKESPRQAASPKVTTPRGKAEATPKADAPVPASPAPQPKGKPHVPRVAMLAKVKPKPPPKEEEEPEPKPRPVTRSLYPAAPRRPVSAPRQPRQASKQSNAPSESSAGGDMAAAAAAAAAAGRTVRITSDYSEEEMTGNDESRTTEGESESERPTERPTERTERADRAVRKTMSEGMNTLREGDIKELASSESMPPEDAAQTWQNRWRRQSECMEDPDPEAQAEPEEIADAKCQESALPSPRTSMLDDRALGEGLELASEAKLVSIPQTEVPVLPAPGEARRPQDVHRESIGGPFEGTHSRHERMFDRSWPRARCKPGFSVCSTRTEGRAMTRKSGREGHHAPVNEERRASRRHALHAAELSAGAPLKLRIERRLAAMQDAENVEPVMMNPRTPEFGEAPRTPCSRSPSPVTPCERRRKSRRITFSALNDALNECVECEQSVASNIQAAQELVKKMFANPPDTSKRQSKKRSRGKSSRQSDARSSVGPEAMTERARRLWESGVDDDDEDEDVPVSSTSVPLLATPGRFRYRTKGAFHDPWASLPPRRSPKPQMQQDDLHRANRVAKLLLRSFTSFEEPYPTEELKEVPQLPTPVESTASSRRKTIVGVPGEVRELVAMVTPVPSAVTVASVASVASVATVSPPEGPRIEARSEESQVSHLEPQKFASEPLPMETKPQSPERHLEEFQASSATSPSKESPKRSKMKSRSRSTSFNDAEEKRAIRADGLQELLQEVYDKFRRCSAQLREADLHGKIQAPGSNAGAEDTDLADTWQEVEWLRQAVVGMHSHLLLAQKRQNVLEKRCKDFQDKISEIRPAPDSTLLAPPRPEKEEKPRAVYASHVANIANVANVAVANVPCNSTPRGRGPVTTYVHPAQIRAASAPQVGLGRVAMPKSYASEVCLPSPRQVFQESPALRRQGPQAFVPVHSASPGKLPLTSRQMQFASMEGSPIFMPSPQSAAHASPAQGVRAWLSSPMPSISAPVTPVGTPVATPRVSPAPTPAPTPPVPGPGCSRVQSLRSERFFRQWLKSYRLSKFAARRAAGETPELWLCAAFKALGSYTRMRHEKELQRRKAQRCRWRLLLQFAWQGLRRGVERTSYCRTEAERRFALKARSVEEELFSLWHNLVDFTRNDRASASRTQHLLMKVFQGFKRYRQDRRSVGRSQVVIASGHCAAMPFSFGLFGVSVRDTVVHAWLLHWRTAVVSWREIQRKDRKALVQWYVVLISSTLKSWRSWCNDRRVKKQRQEEASQLFLGAARRWSLAALFRCHEERQSFAEQDGQHREATRCEMLQKPQVAEQEWELLAQKRATLAVAAANRWRQKLYLRLGASVLLVSVKLFSCLHLLHGAAQRTADQGHVSLMPSRKKLREAIDLPMTCYECGSCCFLVSSRAPLWFGAISTNLNVKLAADRLLVRPTPHEVSDADASNASYAFQPEHVGHPYTGQQQRKSELGTVWSEQFNQLSMTKEQRCRGMSRKLAKLVITGKHTMADLSYPQFP
eukprot:s272_g9.t2